jgi:dTDP-4-dehydrorhamnose reductase
MTDPAKSIILTGSEGQLGRSFRALSPPGVAVRSYSRAELDITDEQAVRRIVGEQQPAWIVNAAAYTAVDRAEDEPERAYAINAEGVRNLAGAASEFGVRLLTVSTDFVFDGRSGVPYPPDATPNPLGAYGASKLAGEKVAGADALIVRTAWVHAATGQNFVKTMLGLLGQRLEVRVVADQVGTPTSALDLAAALWSLMAANSGGIHHYTNAGVASWYDFAVAIREEALATGMLNSAASISPIASKDFPTAAIRPSFAVLDKEATFAVLGGPAPHWRDGLRRTLEDFRNG